MSNNNTPITVILNLKGNHVHQTRPDATVAEAVAMMNLHRIGSLVVSKNEQVVGIFTERDVLVRVVAKGKNPSQTLVSEVMTTELKTIRPETTVMETMQLMTQDRTRHLPVLVDQKLQGMVSIGDITRYLLKLNESEAEAMKEYAFGSYPG